MRQLSLAWRILTAAVTILLAPAVSTLAQTPTILSQDPSGDSLDAQRPTFRTGVTLVQIDVIVRDENGAFVSDLTPDDFVVLEDGVHQEVASVVLVNGGRVYNQLTLPQPVQEGLILPARRPATDIPGRIIIFFIDELHLQADISAKLRHFITEIGDILVHEGDLVGLVSNGQSALKVDLTYDRELIYSAARRLIGSGMGPRELILELQRGARGVEELRWRAHRAFWTVNNVLRNLETIENRRKVLIYISTGYDLNPFSLQRLYRSNRRDEFLRDRPSDLARSDPGWARYVGEASPIERIEEQGVVFADGELIGEMNQLAQTANRANTTFYALDPRGLVSGPDIEYDVPLDAWREYMATARSSLRTLSELTGGEAIVNTNNFDELLTRIDAETSDYYVLGYYASSPDETTRTRALDVSVKRENVTVRSRTQYTFSPDAVAAP